MILDNIYIYFIAKLIAKFKKATSYLYPPYPKIY